MILANEAGLIILTVLPALLLWSLGFIVGRHAERSDWIDAERTDRTMFFHGKCYKICEVIDDELDFSGDDEYPS